MLHHDETKPSIFFLFKTTSKQGHLKIPTLDTRLFSALIVKTCFANKSATIVSKLHCDAFFENAGVTMVAFVYKKTLSNCSLFKPLTLKAKELPTGLLREIPAVSNAAVRGSNNSSLSSSCFVSWLSLLMYFE